MPVTTEETLNYFRKKWGFSYINPRADYQKVFEKYRNTFIGKLLVHDCTKGPIYVFKKNKKFNSQNYININKNFNFYLNFNLATINKIHNILNI